MCRDCLEKLKKDFLQAKLCEKCTKKFIENFDNGQNIEPFKFIIKEQNV